MAEEWWSFVQKGECLGYTHFKHRGLHNYTRVARVQDRMEIKGMIDLVVVKRDMMRNVQDVRQ